MNVANSLIDMRKGSAATLLDFFRQVLVLPNDLSFTSKLAIEKAYAFSRNVGTSEAKPQEGV